MAKVLGSLHEPVVMLIPGGEGDGPETRTTPSVPVDELRPEKGINPTMGIIGGALAILVGLWALGKLLK